MNVHYTDTVSAALMQLTPLDAGKYAISGQRYSLTLASILRRPKQLFRVAVTNTKREANRFNGISGLNVGNVKNHLNSGRVHAP